MGAEIVENYNPRDSRTDGEKYLLELLRTNSNFDGWKVFEQPHINSLKPDFVLLNPNKGVIIIEVKDWRLESNRYVDGGKIIGDNGELFDVNPITQVEGYKECLFRMSWKNNEVFIENFPNDSYGYIETVVFFYGANRKEVIRFCGENNYTRIWTLEETEYIKKNELLNKKSYIYTYALTKEKSKYCKNQALKSIVDELNAFMACSDYGFEMRQAISLSKEQNKIAELKPGSIRRLKGVAGSGKSLILAEKAVRALKEGKEVIIVTFNITLRHYLRDLCSAQFSDGDKDERKRLRSNLSIVYFHEFLRILFTALEIKLPRCTNQKNNAIDFTQAWINIINNNIDKLQFFKKYDYILIDEGQDFKGEWVRFLKQFYTGKGELLIAYDDAQDIYSHGTWIENPDEIKNIGFRGQVSKLNFTRRLPPEIVEKIELIRDDLSIKGDKILISDEKNIITTSFFVKMTWKNAQVTFLNNKINQIVAVVNDLIGNGNVYEDITILTTNENTGIEITKKFLKNGIKVSHVYDMTGKKDLDKRRNEKWKFYGGTGRLKVCSYHSYKGWQTPNIILVLDYPNTTYNGNKIKTIANLDDYEFVRNALFIAMSRIKPDQQRLNFSFTCMNYIPEYNKLREYFND